MTGLFEGVDDRRAPETRDRNPRVPRVGATEMHPYGQPRTCRECGRALHGERMILIIAVDLTLSQDGTEEKVMGLRRSVFCRACLASERKDVSMVVASLAPEKVH